MYLVGIFKRSSTIRPYIKRIFRCFLTIFTLVFCADIKAQSTASKQVTKFTIAAPQLDTVKQIWVYLPKNYTSSRKRYPVIYMHDAQNLFDAETSYVGEWQIDEYLDTLHKNQSIIIGIEHGNEKRIDELTPFKNEKYGGGNGNNYLLFIKNTLKPYIDQNYRTLTKISNTTIFGSSLGGLISFYAVIKYPDTFGKAGVFSPAFWINPEVFEEVKSAKIAKSTKFFFLAGTAESETMISDMTDMVNLLSEKGIHKSNIKTEIIKDGEHNELLWSSYFGQAYNWLY